eukprot:COSAG01_NODE_5091_length_4492_cov_3.461311_8_plen_270_part_00
MDPFRSLGESRFCASQSQIQQQQKRQRTKQQRPPVGQQAAMGCGSSIAAVQKGVGAGGGSSSPSSRLVSAAEEAAVQSCLFELIGLLGGTARPPVQKVSAVLGQAVASLLGAQTGALLFVDEIKMQLLVVKERSEAFERIDMGSGNLGGRGVVGQVAKSGQAYRDDESSQLWPHSGGVEPCFGALVGGAAGPGRKGGGAGGEAGAGPPSPPRVHSCLALPITTLDGKVVGVLLALNKAGFESAGVRAAPLISLTRRSLSAAAAVRAERD